MANFSTIPDPTVPHMTWERWAETVVGFNSDLLGLYQLRPELPWKEFARRLCQVEPRCPRPEFFGEDWRKWATALIRAVVSS